MSPTETGPRKPGGLPGKRVFSRRRFLRRAAIAGAAALVATPTYAHFVETTWLKLTRLRIGGPSSDSGAGDAPTARFVHITDLHYAGDRGYLESVVRRTNELSPDFLCITGDFTDNRRYFVEELEILSRLKAPVFSVLGNWDYWARLPLRELEQFCAAGGGALLVNRSVVRNDLVIAGLDDMANGYPSPAKALAGNVGTGNVGTGPSARATSSRAEGPASTMQAEDRKALLLAHCPMSVTLPGFRKVTLTVAGHSHGGQVRIPFLPPLWLPRCVGPYVRGLYQTPHGPLYVNSGIGASILPMRFHCRPEIALIEI